MLHVFVLAAALQPFLAKHCNTCHNAQLKTAGLNLTAVAPDDLAVWYKVSDKLRRGLMPPPGAPQPGAAERKTILAAIDAALAKAPRDPGRVTARRLNRYEYNNTVRDLLAVDFRPADDFPADDQGYGFDNIGDVLTLSPVLMEKYLAAAARIAALSIQVEQPVKPTLTRYRSDRLQQNFFLRTRHRFPIDAEYDLNLQLGGIRPEGSPVVRLAVDIDGHRAGVFEVNPERAQRRNFDLRLPVSAGEHEVHARFIEDDYRPETVTLAARDRHLNIDTLDVRGPFEPLLQFPPAGHRRVMICGHAAGGHQPYCARLIVTNLARRAWRRPPAPAEINRLVGFVETALQEGGSLEEGVRVALQAVLVSPHFLFRIERQIGEFELATRLSYFLWASLPDEELYQLAAARRLRQPGVLEAQVRRMLRSPKASALIENFVGQWLQLRNLESHKPDPDRFPAFDDELRQAMLRETQLFFETIIREDRSILDLIDARYTFLNERLAKHYGIAGVQGPEFRRVELATDQRGGVLTHASVLTVSSYPTRTSPVLRGKWLLENILGAPPPPPPPDVPNLEEEAIGTKASLRDQLEQHRKDPTCASCHDRMDPLGFAFENYDAIGAWRTRDGKFPIDPSGVLPNGKSFRRPADLKAILRTEKDAFAESVAEKMLTYALGRGLEAYDKPAVQSISRGLAAGDYRFSRLVVEIARSLPFQSSRGERAK
jgi:hypothetical protein